MPIVTEDSQPTRRRHAPWWVLGLAAVVLLTSGLIGWSCIHPVSVELGGCELTFGVLYISHGNGYTGWERRGNDFDLTIALPGKQGRVYAIMWFSP